jgi:cell division cycle 2-like
MGAEEYSTAVDMWSVGCIFAELLLHEPLFQAKSELELISMIFKLLGPPTPYNWPCFNDLPLSKKLSLPPSHPHNFRQRFPHLSLTGIDLLSNLLQYDPDRRFTAEQALKHPYFQ